MKRSRTPSDEAPQKGAESAGPGNALPGEQTATPPSTPAGKLEAARLLLDRGLSREANTQLTELIKSLRDEQLLAEARCALASALAWLCVPSTVASRSPAPSFFPRLVIR